MLVSRKRMTASKSGSSGIYRSVSTCIKRTSFSSFSSIIQLPLQSSDKDHSSIQTPSSTLTPPTPPTLAIYQAASAPSPQIKMLSKSIIALATMAIAVAAGPIERRNSPPSTSSCASGYTPSCCQSIQNSQETLLLGLLPITLPIGVNCVLDGKFCSAIDTEDSI
jgi:hypothetical protein